MRQRISMKKTTEMTLKEAYELFERKGRVRNLSENTLNTYKYHFDALCRCIDENRMVHTITQNEVDEFILYLKNECKVKSVTINSYLRTIRVFLYFCTDSGYMPAFRIGMVKEEKKIKETYTTEELERPLEKPDISKCRFSEYRAWVFENFLVATGMRISSALNVKIKDLDFTEYTIFIRKTKNRKQQVIPLSYTLAEILREYLEIREGDEDSYVFCNDFGEKGNRRTYQQLIQRYNLSRNVNKTSCHLFRHTFAKNWILAGGDIFRLQKILGHYDLEMTKEYLAMFGQDLQMDFEKFNPLDRLKKNKSIIRM